MSLPSHPKCPQVLDKLWSSLVFKAQYNLYVVNMSQLEQQEELFANTHIFEEG